MSRAFRTSIVFTLLVAGVHGVSWAQQGRTPAAIRKDSTATRKRLERQTETFLKSWRGAWKKQRLNEGAAFEKVAMMGTATVRLQNAHCHWDGTFNGSEGSANPNGPRPNLIRSASTRFAVCPDWSPDNSSGMTGGFHYDDLLGADTRGRIREQRLQLLAALDSASTTYPRDGWYSGQRVRFAVDAGENKRALDAAQSCEADEAFCTGLIGYAVYEAGYVALADSVFESIPAMFDEPQRCQWVSVASLFRGETRTRLQNMACAEQIVFARNLWWLADPMYSEPGNERRAEHYARRVRLALHAALPFDELYTLDDAMGSDAVTAMLLRYGWPSSWWWGGPSVDAAHSGWLEYAAMEPYTVPEYSQGRIATLPYWEAAIVPFNVTEADFELNAPPGLAPTDWWPSEHFARAAGPIAALPTGQPVFFRRDSVTEFHLVSKLSAPAFESRRDRADAILMLSTAHEDTRVLGTQPVVFGNRVVLHAKSDTLSGIVSLEIPARIEGMAAARSRFGIVVPAPLSRLQPGEKALSPPVLFEVPGSEVPLPESGNAVLEQALSSLRLVSPGQVGFFWESYGFKAEDSIAMSIRVQRITTPGRLQRAAIALGLSSDPNSAVTYSWREPSTTKPAASVKAMIPVLARHVALDLSSMISGEYLVQVSMQKAGDAAVSSSRIFTIVR